MNPTSSLCSFSLPIKSLRALLLIAGTDDTRFQLKGIRCEVSPLSPDKACVTLIATDGRRLLVLDATKDVRSGSFLGRCDFTIPTHMIRNLLATEGKKGAGFLKVQGFQSNGDHVHLSVEQHAGPGAEFRRLTFGTGPALSCPLAEYAVYPDWRVVVPDSLKPAPAGILCMNAEMLGDFGEAFRLLFGEPCVCLYVADIHTDSPPFVVLPSARQYSPFTCLGMLMPMRGSTIGESALAGALHMPMLDRPDTRAHGHYAPPSAPLLI